MTKYIYCCDWGTTSLRIRLIDIGKLEIIDQLIIPEGIAYIYDKWQIAVSVNTLTDRVGFYLSKLRGHLETLASRIKIDVGAIPVIISGMASSSIGIKELPYAETPFDLSGEKTNIHYIKASPSFNHCVLVISGVKDGDEVMRGEEIQLIGIRDHLTSLNSPNHLTILLPGTHSKHVGIHRGRITSIETYVTGELFSLLSKNGLLQNAVQAPKDDAEVVDWDVFTEGVKISGSVPILQALFKVRTNQLFQRLTKQQNYNYLSGLLIGSELRKLMNKSNTQLVLCCGNNLNEHYKVALRCLGLEECTHFLTPIEFERATVKGQVVLAKNFINHSSSETI